MLPQELSLHQAGIVHAGDEFKISELCDGVTLLDLSENNISDWDEVIGFFLLLLVYICFLEHLVDLLLKKLLLHFITYFFLFYSDKKNILNYMYITL